MTRSMRRQTADEIGARIVNGEDNDAVVALMNLRSGVADASLANLDPLCFAPSMRQSPPTREGEVRVSGESDNNNDVGAAAGETAASENPALGEQDGDSESVAENINGTGAAAAVNENSAVHEQDEDGESSAANNINAARGTVVLLSIVFATSSGISRLPVHYSLNTYLTSEVLAQRHPITFEIGGFEVTVRARPPPPRDREVERNVQRRTARGPGEQNAVTGT